MSWSLRRTQSDAPTFLSGSLGASLWRRSRLAGPINSCRGTSLTFLCRSGSISSLPPGLSLLSMPAPVIRKQWRKSDVEKRQIKVDIPRNNQQSYFTDLLTTVYTAVLISGSKAMNPRNERSLSLWEECPGAWVQLVH